jgi:hypothetical protein
VAHINNRILFCLIKERNSVICNNMEDNMLNKISQTQKDEYCAVPLIYEMLKVDFIEVKNGIVVSRSRLLGKIKIGRLEGANFQPQDEQALGIYGTAWVVMEVIINLFW